MCVKINIFYGVMTHNLVESNISEEPAASSFRVIFFYCLTYKQVKYTISVFAFCFSSNSQQLGA
jgi:hypothetical protein